MTGSFITFFWNQYWHTQPAVEKAKQCCSLGSGNLSNRWFIFLVIAYIIHYKKKPSCDNFEKSAMHALMLLSALNVGSSFISNKYTRQQALSSLLKASVQWRIQFVKVQMCKPCFCVQRLLWMYSIRFWCAFKAKPLRIEYNLIYKTGHKSSLIDSAFPSEKRNSLVKSGIPSYLVMESDLFFQECIISSNFQPWKLRLSDQPVKWQHSAVYWVRIWKCVSVSVKVCICVSRCEQSLEVNGETELVNKLILVHKNFEIHVCFFHKTNFRWPNWGPHIIKIFIFFTQIRSYLNFIFTNL